MDDLKVVRCNDPACAGNDEAITTVDATGITGQHTSITIGADAYPIISYLGGSGLLVARLVHTSWVQNNWGR